MLIILILLLGICSRFVIHVPNFTPVLAIALFAGAYVKNRKLSILVPFAIMFASDAIIGFHETVLFTWGSIILIALLGRSLRAQKTWLKTMGTSLCGAILFFIITNFGVWILLGTYTHTFSGLVECYLRAIPYFRNTLLSTLIYTLAFFYLYDFLSAKLKNTKFAFVL